MTNKAKDMLNKNWDFPLVEPSINNKARAGNHLFIIKDAHST